MTPLGLAEIVCFGLFSLFFFFLPPSQDLSGYFGSLRLIFPGFVGFVSRPSLNQHILFQVQSFIILPLPVTVLPIRDMSSSAFLDKKATEDVFV